MSAKEKYNIKTEEDFNRVLDEIDREMRDDSVPITARQIKGWLKFSSRFGLGLSMSDPLSQKVMDWFEVRYGDRLKIDHTVGEMAVLIRGDLFKLRFPTYYGSINVICDPKFWMSEPGTQIAVKEDDPLPVVNVLNCIEELTESYALTLTIDEQRELFNLFLFGTSAMQDLDAVRGVAFVEEAKGDLRASVSHLFDRPPQYGLSKWSSLQATEKFIKAYITQKGTTPPFSHDLQRLATIAESLGLPVLPQTELSKIQCPADVRYGRVPVTPAEAVEAQHAAIKACAEIAKSI